MPMMRTLDVECLLRLTRSRPEPLVVMIIGGRGATVRCLNALIRCTPTARVMVIDDGTGDPSVVEELDRRAATGDIQLVRHDRRWGAWKTVQQALQIRNDGDLALINGAVEVGPGWLRGLRRAAFSRDNVAAVSALVSSSRVTHSNSIDAAGWPGHLTWPEIARGMGQADLAAGLVEPVGDMACMLITRQGIKALSDLSIPDDDPDWSRHLGPHGAARELVHLVAPRVVVHDARHHDGCPGVRAPAKSWRSAVLAETLDELTLSLRRAEHVLPRRLHVSQRDDHAPTAWPGLAGQLVAAQDSYILESVGDDCLELSASSKAGRCVIGRWQAQTPWAADDDWRQDYAEVVAGILTCLNIELIHVEQIAGHPLTTLPELARRLEIPLVLSVNDFYLVGPAASAESKGSSTLQWRGRVESLLDGTAGVVTPSEHSALMLSTHFPKHAERIRVIEPGCDLAGLGRLRHNVSRLPGPVRILANADWRTSSGLEYLRSLAVELGPRVEWHVLGVAAPQLADVAVVHGHHRRAPLRRIAADIDPDLAISVATRAEPYSNTLSEFWAMGLPVLATDIGESGDRIRRSAAGLLLPADDPVAAARQISALIDDPVAVRALRRQVPRVPVNAHVSAVESYRQLYLEVEGSPKVRHRIGYVIHGAFGKHGSCEHIRVLLRLRNASPESGVWARQVLPFEVVSGGILDELDALLVQRDGFGGDTEAALSSIRAAGLRLVVESDDDLVHPEAADRMSIGSDVHTELSDRLLTLYKAADASIVSTEPLRRTLGELSLVDPVVVPNELDARLWLRDVLPAREAKTDGLRILYMGTKTHIEDLLLLRSVLGPVADALGRRVELEVVGVADRFEDDGWITRLRIPAKANNYPEFVTWLRSRRTRWHAAIAPLVESEFNSAKSDLKLLEYAMLGLPVVASNVGPYRDGGELALLTENDPESWALALIEILGNPRTAAARVAAARRSVMRSRLICEEGVQGWFSAVLG